mgnify:CR=1 FL=1
MPSRYRTGNNPFGGATIGSGKGASGDVNSITPKLTNEITRRTPKADMSTNVTHVPNGVIISPINRSRKTVATIVSPWAVSLKTEDSSTLAFVGDGKLYDGQLSITESVVVIDPEGVAVDEDDVVCIEYTYADDTMKIAVVPGEDFNPIIEEGEEGEEVMTKSLFPLAQIVAKEDSNPVALIVNQIVKTNLTTTLICYDGKPVKYFLAI